MRWGNLCATVAAAVFVVLGIWMGLDGSAVGWLAAAFFGVALLVGIGAIVWPEQMIISSEGFELRSWLGRTRARVRWDEVGEFRVMRLKSRGVGIGSRIVYDLVAPPKGSDRMAKAVFGAEKLLPSTYGTSPELLGEMLNGRRLRAEA